jgi:hypothetical protein
MVETFSGEEKVDFSDPAFYKGIFTEYLEKESGNGFDNTQWLTCVSLIAQLLYKQIKTNDLNINSITDEEVGNIGSFVEHSLRKDYERGEISDERIIETKNRLREIVDIL